MSFLLPPSPHTAEPDPSSQTAGVSTGLSLFDNHCPKQIQTLLPGFPALTIWQGHKVHTAQQLLPALPGCPHESWALICVLSQSAMLSPTSTPSLPFRPGRNVLFFETYLKCASSVQPPQCPEQTGSPCLGPQLLFDTQSSALIFVAFLQPSFPPFPSPRLQQSISYSRHQICLSHPVQHPAP